jgi:flagellar protein FlaJ
MKLKKMHWIGIGIGFLVILIGLIFFLNKEDVNLLIFLSGIALAIIAMPFVIDTTIESNKEQEIAEMFLEFSRDLAESVNTGTPISKSIVNMRKKNFGSLSPYVEKLANQISLGIPVNEALRTFAFEVRNPVISRAVELISEAERAGGEIDYILESVALSISEVEKLKKERRSAVYTLVVQGYIIFFIFIGIMLVMEFKILPLTTGIGAIGSLSSVGSLQTLDSSAISSGSAYTLQELSRPFLYLLLVQGVFAGLTIGKLTEGSVKAGIKHSFILTITALLISTGANLFLGVPGS